MGLTFDEAVREYQLRSSIGPLVQGMKLSPFLNVPQQEYDRVKFLNNLFYETINKLRKEYAPTVEMTKTEKNNILSSKKYGLSFINFYADVMHQSTAIKFGVQTNPELYKSFSEEKLMQAWLHPETIKVIGENKNE